MITCYIDDINMEIWRPDARNIFGKLIYGIFINISDVTVDGEFSLLGQPWLLGLVGLGVLFCGIIIIFGCTNLCDREQSFKVRP